MAKRLFTTEKESKCDFKHFEHFEHVEHFEWLLKKLMHEAYW